MKPEPISDRLKFLFVSSYVALWALQLANLFFLVRASADMSVVNYLYYQVLVSIFPGLLLGAAYWYVGKRQNVSSRLFVATVIAYTGFVFGLIAQQISYIFPVTAGINSGEAAQAIVVTGVLILYLCILVLTKKRG